MSSTTSPTAIFDGHVARTRSRPLASGAVSVFEAVLLGVRLLAAEFASGGAAQLAKRAARRRLRGGGAVLSAVQTLFPPAAACFGRGVLPVRF